MKGYIQLYTGNGKGKTTAALGLSVRAAGAGKKVFIGQFVKGMYYSELDLIAALPGITIKQYGRGCFIDTEPTEADYSAAQKGLDEVGLILASGNFDVVVLDEACIALYFRLISLDALTEALQQRAEHVEAVVTGRYAPQELVDLADLVTEMKEVKHYYNNGVEARFGIEK